MTKHVKKITYHSKKLCSKFIKLVTEMKCFIVHAGWQNGLIVIFGAIASIFLLVPKEQIEHWNEYFQLIIHPRM